MTKKGQSFTGLLRWDDEETFWGDLFNSRKQDTPYLDDHGDGGGAKREYEVFGRKISFDWGNSSKQRSFVARFGDISVIEVLDDNEANLLMKDGSNVHVEGSSNDVNPAISIRDPSLGDIEIAWKRVDTITFSQAPASSEPWGERLHGTIETAAGTFRGYVQWDKQESISVDRLDGEEDDIDFSIPMGNLRSITRDGDDASVVELRDGRSLTLTDSNDVDDDNRGLLVEDPRFGKVEIPWMSFNKVTFTDQLLASGPGYDSFAPLGGLRGTVTTKAGERLQGQIVFDLDEERDWELFDGELDGIIYFIPFGLIQSIAPTGDNGCAVKLRSGDTLALSETQDAAEDNAGVLVINGSTETLVAWQDLQSVAFDR